jgi:hypothetical protein
LNVAEIRVITEHLGGHRVTAMPSSA